MGKKCDAATLTTDPSWALGPTWGPAPGTALWGQTKGSLWWPHVYMPNQNPNDLSGANPLGRWDYGAWFWPPQQSLTSLDGAPRDARSLDDRRTGWAPAMDPHLTFRGALPPIWPAYARALVRVAAEKQKPNGERLREFRESALPSLDDDLVLHDRPGLISHWYLEQEILVCRSEQPISADIKRKIALFCNVDFGCVIESPDVRSIYEIPLRFHDQGLDREYFGTPMGEAVSLGIHESQSRLWENQVGRGRPFWEHFLPRLDFSLRGGSDVGEEGPAPGLLPAGGDHSVGQ